VQHLSNFYLVSNMLSLTMAQPGWNLNSRLFTSSCVLGWSLLKN